MENEYLDWINGTRCDILVALVNNRRGLKLSRLSDEVDASQSTLTKALKKLEEMQLVQQDQNGVYYAEWQALAILRALEDVAELVEDNLEKSGGTGE